MPSKTNDEKDMRYYLEKLWLGFRLRCPNCGQGKMFSGLFRMEPTCPHCHVRYERSSGESLGGMMIGLIIVELITVGGYLLSDVLFRPPLLFQMVFWVAFNLAFCLAFYRPARGMWVSVTYLTGGVYADEPAETS
ncbi:MAG: DUF983 domain-containing protein [Anaerolineae bacterium]|nr:DUF983 domain-containing protein [Anaerolineae bacterium]